MSVKDVRTVGAIRGLKTCMNLLYLSRDPVFAGIEISVVLMHVYLCGEGGSRYGL